MIEIKDEILESEARYRMRDAQGNILFDNLTIEQITPVIQQATPQNKVLYDSIKSGNDLVQKFNIPNALPNDGEYNYLELDNVITKYETGMRVFVEIKNGLESFNSSPIPEFNSESAINGYSISGGWEAFDKDDSTGGTVSGQTGYGTIIFPSAMKIKKIKAVFKRVALAIGGAYTTANIQARPKGSTSYTQLAYDANTEVGDISLVIERDDETLYDSIRIGLKCSTSSGGSYMTSHTLYTLDVLEGEKENFVNGNNTYININGLGNILINGSLEENKKYLLVYDGTVFNATEVV